MDNSNLQQKISSLCRDFTCGFCEAQLGYKIQFSDYSETYAEYGDFISGGACAVVSCNHCNRLNILLFYGTTSYENSRSITAAIWAGAIIASI